MRGLIIKQMRCKRFLPDPTKEEQNNETHTQKKDNTAKKREK